MVVKFINFIVYRIYNYTKSYLLDHNCLVDKDTFDYSFWGGF